MVCTLSMPLYADIFGKPSAMAAASSKLSTTTISRKRRRPWTLKEGKEASTESKLLDRLLTARVQGFLSLSDWKTLEPFKASTRLALLVTNRASSDASTGKDEPMDSRRFRTFDAKSSASSNLPT